MDTSRHPLPPNALSSFEHIRELLQNKTPVVFLDYDGTLAPIVSRPDEAYMTETMRAAVKTVAEKFVTAVVTGRSTQKVVNFVKLNELFPEYTKLFQRRNGRWDLRLKDKTN